MQGLGQYQQAVIGMLAIAATVLGFLMGINVRFVKDDYTKDAPAVMCVFSGIVGAIAVAVLGCTGKPIACAALFVSNLVMGIGIGFMTTPRKVSQ